ncbi:hypothetical protein [Ferrimicrobium acidiphilum]|jgi:hypothetical protein|nr:hypothetical protein [Ferrimicrobium acidiphilum]
MPESCDTCGQLFLPLPSSGRSAREEHVLAHHLEQFLAMHDLDYIDA